MNVVPFTNYQNSFPPVILSRQAVLALMACEIESLNDVQRILQEKLPLPFLLPGSDSFFKAELAEKRLHGLDVTAPAQKIRDEFILAGLEKVEAKKSAISESKDRLEQHDWGIPKDPFMPRDISRPVIIDYYHSLYGAYFRGGEVMWGEAFAEAYDPASAARRMACLEGLNKEIKTFLDKKVMRFGRTNRQNSFQTAFDGAEMVKARDVAVFIPSEAKKELAKFTAHVARTVVEDVGNTLAALKMWPNAVAVMQRRTWCENVVRGDAAGIGNNPTSSFHPHYNYIKARLKAARP